MAKVKLPMQRTHHRACTLCEAGCGFGQGFHFYRPMDGETAAQALRTAYDFRGTGD